MKNIEQRVKDESDLIAAKTILTDDLQKRYNACVAFTLYQEIYNCFPSYRTAVCEQNYTDLMKNKYISVYHAVEARLERWKEGTE